ncbi:MAG: TonB-dependent receptor [Rhodocyclales bacterium]|nr:TonB-dependent receptor [Rhodocyclales bacterium]
MHASFLRKAFAPFLFSAVFSVQAATSEDEATVVVTASRFSAPALEQPIAIQVITAEQIRESTAVNVSEVLSKLGGVHARINFLGIPDSPIDLRGFGMSGDQNTLLLVNGQRYSENELISARISAIPLDSIERIEILRGAGAVLYGGGATGGTINIITRSPLSVPSGGNVSLALGSHEMRDARGSFSAGSGPWGLSLHAQSQQSDNYRQNNHSSQDAVSGEWRYVGDEGALSLRFGADDQRARLPGPRTELQLKTDPRGTSTPNDYANSRSEQAGLHGEQRFGDVTVAADAGQRRKTSRYFFDFGFGFSSRQDTEVTVNSVSPRLHWNTTLAGMANRLTAGVDWSEWSYGNDTLSGFGNRDESGRQHNRAVYVRDELGLTATTRLTAGLRRERVEQEQRERLTPLPKADSSRNLTASELALQQQFGGGWSAYGRLGRSFRVANIDENRCFFPPCAPLLKPQTSQDREIGLQWRAGKAAFRASLFDIDLKNELHYNAITFTNMNLQPTRRRGLELEGKAPLGADLELGARYAYTDARFRDGSYGGFDVGGNQVPLVPRQRAGLSLGWKVAVPTRLTFSLSHIGEQRYDNDQRNLFRRMPSYTVADIKLSHQAGSWRLAAGVNNLFDKAYYSYAIVNGAFTTFNAYPEDRRNAYVSAELKF